MNYLILISPDIKNTACKNQTSHLVLYHYNKVYALKY